MNHIHLEELAMNAWPAMQTVLYDGWIVRFARGYTKRANSVTPLYPGSLPIAEKIEWCEQSYRQENLRPTFRLTGATKTGEYDESLANRGYERIDTTSVQTVGLHDIDAAPTNRVEIITDVSGIEPWLRSYHELQGQKLSDDKTHKDILSNIRGKAGYLSLIVDGEVAACGLGVVERGYLGIFDVITAVSQRNKGYATELMQNLLAWGKACGAQYSYLQVMTNNPPALRLYAKLGYTEQYQYWYRVFNG